MDPIIISWTPTNWVTVLLMVAGGFLVIKVAMLGIKYLATRSSAPASA